jgi:DNA-directed RNA polymerase subunit RPC12/RpoP
VIILNKFIEEVVKDRKDLEYKLIDGVNDDKLNAIWFKEPVITGKYKGINFEIIPTNEEKYIVLSKLEGENVTDILKSKSQSKDEIDVLPNMLKELNLPIEDETYYAINDDIKGIELEEEGYSIVGYIEPYDEYMLKLDNTFVITLLDNQIDHALEEALDHIEKYKELGSEILVYNCDDCETEFTTEDLIQYLESAGFHNFDSEKIKELGNVSCIECNSENVFITIK